SDLMKALASEPGEPGNSGAGQIEEAVLKATGLHLRPDILDQFGSRITFYSVPTQTTAPAHVLEGLAQGLFRVPKFAFLIDLKNRDAALRALDKLVAWYNHTLLESPAERPGNPIGEIRPLKGQPGGYVVYPSGPE